jgi:hypothetical protein
MMSVDTEKVNFTNQTKVEQIKHDRYSSYIPEKEF